MIINTKGNHMIASTGILIIIHVWNLNPRSLEVKWVQHFHHHTNGILLHTRTRGSSGWVGVRSGPPTWKNQIYFLHRKITPSDHMENIDILGPLVKISGSAHASHTGWPGGVNMVIMPTCFVNPYWILEHLYNV